jgi:acyl carrier protein
LRGIIHAAGVLEDGVLQQQDWHRFSRVLAPKVTGSWLLHRFCKDMPLDFFIMFSSIASILGTPGQSNYAAANAYMDSLAHLRRTSGLPALSINWGPWSDSGMAARLKDQDRRRMHSRGFDPINPEQGTAILDLLLDWDATQVAVIPVDWSRLFGLYANAKPPAIFDAMARSVASDPRQGQGVGGSVDLQEQLRNAPPSETADILSEFLSIEVAKVLGLEPSRTVNRTAPFASLGVDSLMAVELQNAVAGAMGRRFPPSLVYDYPSIEKLTEFLLQDFLTPTDAAPKAAVPSKPVDRLSALENLTDEEIENLYRQKGID